MKKSGNSKPILALSKRRLVVAALFVVALGCLFVTYGAGARDSVSAPLDTQLGGDTTKPDASRNAFGFIASNLPSSDRREFVLGNSFFTENWVTAPASTDVRDGLGPTFNAQACATCHTLDGRGAPPTGPDDTTTRGLLARLSLPGSDAHGGPLPDSRYGDQLEDRAILGVPAEGKLLVDYREQPGSYQDGSPFSLRVPSYRVEDLALGPLQPGTMISPRLAPQVIGMGLLEAIPERTLLAAADPQDANGDGISGRANSVWNATTNTKVIGRFGWKANQPTTEQQVAGAFSGDMGITSSVFPKENCGEGQTACKAALTGGDPEIEGKRFASVVFYSRTLAVPAMRNVKESNVKKGAEAFMAMGCATCHTPTVETGASDIPGLANQTIHPFTDLLLHDMGPGLADGRPDFEATGTEWRTPPLWGLGLSKDVNGNFFLLHDGRARSFEEAILWHGGEAEAAREKFRTANAKERGALIRYLESL